MNLDTDSEWERWGQHEPYFGVITQPRFRRHALTPQSKSEFFASGDAHVDYVMRMIHLYIDPSFAPQRVLDFGCGVGRTLLPFSKIAETVIGLDVSQSMLSEASANCLELGATNIVLSRSDDELSQVDGVFDLVHSFIVFQHIPPVRGKAILGRLIRKIGPGGIGALHVLYSKSGYRPSLGVALSLPNEANDTQSSGSTEPQIQMNAYGATELMFMIQDLGVHRVHVEFTDHGGEWGLFLFFKVPE